MLTTCGNFTTCGILEAMCGFVVCVVQNSPNILVALGLYFARLAQEAISRDGLLTLLRPPDMYPTTKPGCDCLPRLRCSGSYVGCSSLWKFRERPEVQTGCTGHLHNCSTAQRFQRKALTVRDPLTLKHGNGLFTLKKMTHVMFPLIHLTVTDLLKYVKSFAK